MGGDPDVPRAGRQELRPVGPRDRRDRPLQDRVRRSRRALHRCLGPRPRPARTPGVRARPAGPGVVDAAPPRACNGRERGRLHRGRRRLTSIHVAIADELDDWDERTVDAPGGHVYQSRAWAEHRVAAGWEADLLVHEDGYAALALRRPFPADAGCRAAIPRGPIAAGEPA